jgi:hypothetical protein
MNITGSLLRRDWFFIRIFEIRTPTKVFPVPARRQIQVS